MGQFKDFQGFIMGFVPRLSVFLAEQLINAAWRDIQESRRWSFKVAETVLQAPGQITVGAASVTQFSNQVTGNAVASAAWTGLSNPILTLRQFRVPTGPIYNIIAADFTNLAAVVLTLDRDYQEITNSTATYMIYRCYYQAPSSDFLKWTSIVDPFNGYQFGSTSATKAEVDRWDPLRGALSNPTVISTYKYETIGNDPDVPTFEMWPHPTAQISYRALYQKRVSKLVDPADSIPVQIPDEVLQDRTLYRAYQWCEANKGARVELQGSNWQSLWTEVNNNYAQKLQQAKVQDEEIFIQNWGSYMNVPFLYPNTGQFWQSHAPDLSMVQ